MNKRSPKREAIIEAAQALFLEHGYGVTSMDMVAGKAGVSKATIYAHFAGKDDLFAAVIHRHRELDFDSMPPWERQPDAGTALTQAGTDLIRLILSPDVMGMHRVVVAEAPRQPELARAFWEAGPAYGKARVVALFADLDRRGLLSVPEAWAAADQFLGMLRSEVFYRTLLGLALPEGRSPQTTVANAVDTMLRAYAPRKACAG